ncbi:SPOR domain-containing protein [Aminivibrio sp.]
MATRESRRLKEKRSVIPFGDIMLPVIGLVAVGLLIVGVKMFFLSGDKSAPYTPPPARTSRAAPQKPPVREAVPSSTLPSPPREEKPEGKGGGEVALAVPAGSSGKAAPAEEGESPIASPPDSKPAGAAKKPQPQKPPAPIEKPKAPSMRESRWGVQIGAFSSRESAESLRKQVSNSGYSAAVTTAVVEGKTFYRVTVAAGKERSSAVSLSEKLQNAGYPVLVVEVR